jgi:RNA polymerase sigma-70 factor (ECF subfamily)
MVQCEAKQTRTLAELIVAAQSNNESCANEAQGELFTLAYNRTLRYARTLVNAEDAEDITQEALFTALRKLYQLENAAAFYGWLQRITHNMAINHVTRNRKFRQLDIDTADQRVGCEADAMTLAIRNECRAEIRNCLKRLPAEQQVLLRMHHVEDMPLGTIAAMHNIPVGTAKSRMYTARVALRNLIDAQAV